ncbi:hypothetical protein KA531_00435 [Candidatus Saccharibacteria bacterium]|nr:hypothetical protein [Candidatus Saccharibacteria bacterium]
MSSKTFTKRKFILHIALLLILGTSLDLAIRSPIKLRFDLADLPNFVKIEKTNDSRSINQTALASDTNSNNSTLANSQDDQAENPEDTSAIQIQPEEVTTSDTNSNNSTLANSQDDQAENPEDTSAIQIQPEEVTTSVNNFPGSSSNNSSEIDNITIPTTSNPLLPIEPIEPLLPILQPRPNNFNLSSLSPNNQVLNSYQIELDPNQSSIFVNNTNNRTLNLTIGSNHYNVLGNSTMEILAPSSVFSLSCRCSINAI